MVTVLLIYWRRLSSLNKSLGFVVLPVVLAANVLCAVRAMPNNVRNSIAETKVFLHRYTGDDSWGPMHRALQSLNEHPELPMYRDLFFEKKVKFQYPLSSLLPVQVVEKMSRFIPPIKILNALSLLSVWLTAILCGKIMILASRPDAPRGGNALVTVGLSAVLTLLFYPVVKAYTLGQIQTWICALFTAAVYLALIGRWRAAGVLLAISCTIKPQLAVVILWAILRKRWDFVTSAMAVLCVAVLATLVLFGWREQLEYLAVLRFIGDRGESFYPNHSVNGLLNRLLFNGNNLEWNDNAFAPPLALVHWGTLTSSAVMVSLALFWRRREHMAAPVVDLCIAVLTATAASPIAWEHHYGVMVAMYAATCPLFLRYRPLGAWTGRLLLGTFVVSGSFISVVQRLAETRFNVLQSYLFIAAMTFLALLYALRHAIARGGIGEQLRAAPVVRPPIAPAGA